MIQAIDLRPKTGELYALVVKENGTDPDHALLFRIDMATGAASQVGNSPFVTDLTDNNNDVFGMDFNPASDRVRVVNSVSAVNVRVNPDTGALAGNDPHITWAAGDSHEGVTSAYVGALAYFASSPEATTGTPTTLYAIAIDADSLARIGGEGGDPSPNSGSMSTIGPLGLLVNGVRLSLDIGDSGSAFAAVQGGSNSTLRRANLENGQMTSTLGIVGPSGMGQLDGLAVLPGGRVGFTGASVTANEGAASVDLTVTRAGTSWAGESVEFSAAPASATPGTDYTATSGRLDFAAGETTKTVTIPLLDDTAYEGQEAFLVRLRSAAGGARIVAGEAVVVLEDNDAVPAPAAPAPAPLPPVADTIAPFIALAPAADPTRTVARRGLRVSYACTEACTTQFELRAGRAVIGRARRACGRPARRRGRSSSPSPGPSACAGRAGSR